MWPQPFDGSKVFIDQDDVVQFDILMVPDEEQASRRPNDWSSAVGARARAGRGPPEMPG